MKYKKTILKTKIQKPVTAKWRYKI